MEPIIEITFDLVIVNIACIVYVVKALVALLDRCWEYKEFLEEFREKKKGQSRDDENSEGIW